MGQAKKTHNNLILVERKTQTNLKQGLAIDKHPWNIFMWWLQPICFSCKFQLQLPSKYRKKNHYQLSTLMILKVLSYLVPCYSSQCNIAHSIVMQYSQNVHLEPIQLEQESWFRRLKITNSL